VATGPLPNLLLFLAAPEVTRLVAREGYGTPVPVRELGRTPDFVLFVADFGPATNAGFGYTAYDNTGAVVEDAIT
jgi:hypothetical protein